jgi:hypothetical protein
MVALQSESESLKLSAKSLDHSTESLKRMSKDLQEMCTRLERETEESRKEREELVEKEKKRHEKLVAGMIYLIGKQKEQEDEGLECIACEGGSFVSERESRSAFNREWDLGLD